MEDLLNLEYAQRLLLEDKQESRIRAMQTITTRVEMIFREGKSDEVFKRLIKEIIKIEVDFINVSAALYRRAGLFMLRSIVRGISPSFFILPQTSEPAAQPTLLKTNSYHEQFMQKCVPMFLNSVGDVEAKVRLAAVEGCHELLRRTKLFLIKYFFFDFLCALANSIHDRDRQVASLADDVSSVMRELIRGDASFVIDYTSFTKFIITVLEPFIHRHHKTVDEERVINWVLDWVYFVLDLPNAHFICCLPEYLPLLLELSSNRKDDLNCNSNVYESVNNYKNFTSATTANVVNTMNANVNDNDSKTINVTTEGNDNRNVKRAVNPIAEDSTHIGSISSHGKNVYYSMLLYKVLKECRVQTHNVIMREKSRQEKEENDKLEQIVDHLVVNTDNDKAITSQISSKGKLDIQAILAILIHTISKTRHIRTLQVCIEWTHELYEIAPSSLLQLLPDLIVKCILPLQDVQNLTIKKDVKELENILKELICQRTIYLSNTSANDNIVVDKSTVSLEDKNELLKHIAQAIIHSLSGTSLTVENKHNKADELVLDNVNNNGRSSVINNHNTNMAMLSCDKSEAYIVTALSCLKMLHSCCASAMQPLTLTLYKHTTHLLANASEKVMFAHITVLCIWSGTEMFDTCLENIFHHLHGNVEATSLLLTRLPSILKRLQLFYEDAFATEHFSCTKVMCKFAEMLSSSSSSSSSSSEEESSLLDMRWRCKFVITCQMLLLTADEFTNARQLLRQCTENNSNNHIFCKNSSNDDANGNGNTIFSSYGVESTINRSSNIHNDDKDGNDRLHCEAHRVFDVLFKSWCVNAISALGLCLLASQFVLAWRICATLGKNEVSSSTLLQLDRLIQLFESPVFTWLRSLLVLPLEYSSADSVTSSRTPENSKREYLICSLYAILAILPQSSPQYRSLYTRLKLTKQMANLPFYRKQMSLEANNVNSNNNSSGCCHSLHMEDAMKETNSYFQLFVQAQ